MLSDKQATIGANIYELRSRFYDMEFQRRICYTTPMEQKHPHRKSNFILILLAVIIVILGGSIFYVSRTNVRMRLLCNVLHFVTNTLESPSYLLYDVDIMELCRDYGNGDILINGRMGFDGLEQVSSSIYFDVEGSRSFSQKRMESTMDMSLLWIELGELNLYAEDETVYLTAPLLGEEIGYAFPTGQNLFLKMPELSHDLDKEWFQDHTMDIIDFMANDISIVETGEILVDEDGTKSDELVITVPQGTGDFIWELLGMEAPDYDVVTTLYLTSDNHLRRVSVDLSDVLPGASMMIDGEDIGTSYFLYKLPDDEQVTLKMVRNPNYTHWIDSEAIYSANNGSKYSMTTHITWQEEADGTITLKARDIAIMQDGKQKANGYFSGSIEKASDMEALFVDEEDRLYALEELDWKAVRDDAESFIDDVLSKANLKLK